MRLRDRHIRWIAAAALIALPVALPGPARSLEAIGFSAAGAEEDLAERLRNASLAIGAREQDTTETQEVLAAARADYARFLGVLYEEGYFGGTISIRADGREVADIPPLDEPARVGRIDIRIVPGPLYLYSEAEVAPIPPDMVIPEEYAAGQPARTPAIGAAARTAVNSWRDLGFAKADIAGQSITANHPLRRVAARLTVEPGPRVRFGDLQVTGNTGVRTARVREIAGFPTGDVFSPAAVEEVTSRLRRTGTFRSVVLREAETVGPDGTLDMELALTEAPLRRLGFGAEFSSDEGLTLSGFWLHRNLFGGAEQIELALEFTNIASADRDIGTTFSVRFQRPATFRPDTDFYILGSLDFLDERDYSGEAFGVGAGFQRRFSDELTAEAGLAFNYADITNAFGQNEFIYLTAPVRFTYDLRDSELDPTEGVFLRGEVLPILNIDGTENGVRLSGDARAYRAFGDERRVVLAGRAQIGGLAGPSLANAPNTLLFYSGGGGTVRGQSFEALGVDLGGGLRTGGRSFVGLSAEVRTGITETISAVGFFDWGYIGPDSVPGDSGDSHSGAGIGVRYNTPIGPIRVDLATPVTGPPSSESIFLYIGIGQAF